jgi:hypothetical protein
MTNPDTVTRMLFALSEHEYDIAKTRSWLETFDRSAIEALDNYEEESIRDEENGACVRCPERSES